MSAIVDTNILVRHLTGEPADLVARSELIRVSRRTTVKLQYWGPPSVVTRDMVINS